MKKNNIILLLFFVAGIIGFSSCKEDMMSEITTLNVDRAFSPTELDARVVNRTQVRLDWREVTNATFYKVELFENDSTQAFEGSPAITVDSINASQLPYIITGLSGATDYSIRVKGVGKDIEDSKWVGASIKTDSEQIFQPVDPATLTATSVTLSWTPGANVSTINLSPGNIVHTITTGEMAEGKATITGLVGETNYTALLLRGTKTRGTATFTTLIDLGNAIAVSPGDDLEAMIANANNGDVFALLPGTYDINKDISTSKSITIQGAKPSDKPIIKGLVIRINANAGLSLKDLIMDGTGSTGNQTIVYNEDSADAYGDLNVQNCDFSNYVKGFLYVSKKVLVNNVTYNNNIIHNIECAGGDFIDFRSGIAQNFTFTNNTVYNSALSRDLFRMDSGGSTNFPSVNSNIVITNNTFNEICNSASNRVLYIRLANHAITFSKNIIANSAGMYTNQTSTKIVTVNKNNYFNAPNYTASTSSKYNDVPANNYTTLDPAFASPNTGNFTLGNDDLKFDGIGAARWR
nr:fibronectin type III domain-containing protein [uncultured Pedobacter sp.]